MKIGDSIKVIGTNDPSYRGRVIGDFENYNQSWLIQNEHGKMFTEKKQFCEFWNRGTMTVGQLKQILARYPDDAVLFVHNKEYNTSVTSMNVKSWKSYDNNKSSYVTVTGVFFNHTFSNRNYRS